MQLVRADDTPQSPTTSSASNIQHADLDNGFRKRIRRGEFLSEAARRSRRQRRTSRQRRWIRAAAVGVPLVCLLGIAGVLLSLYVDTYYTTEELLRRVEEIESRTTRYIRPVLHTPSVAAPLTLAVTARTLSNWDYSPATTAGTATTAGITGTATTAGPEGVAPYTVRNRDNLWKVVKRECGLEGDLIAPAVKYVKELNGIKNVKRMQPGDRILLPSRAELTRIANSAATPAQP